MIAPASILHNLYWGNSTPCTHFPLSKNIFYTFSVGVTMMWSRAPKYFYCAPLRRNDKIRLAFNDAGMFLIVKGTFNEIYFPVTPSNFHEHLWKFAWGENNDAFFDPQFWSIPV